MGSRRRFNSGQDYQKPPEVKLAAEGRLTEALVTNCPDLGTVWDTVRIVRSLQQHVQEFRGGISACRRFGQHSMTGMVQRRRNRLKHYSTESSESSELHIAEQDK